MRPALRHFERSDDLENLRSKYSLNLRKKVDRCFLANIAAKMNLTSSKMVTANTSQLLPSNCSSYDSTFKTINQPQQLTVNAIVDLFEGDITSASENLERLFSHNSHQGHIKIGSDDPIVAEIEELKAQLLSKQLELEATSQQLEERSQQLEKESAQRICLEQQLIKQVKLNLIVATERLLPAGPPLNGVQDSPMMKLVGSPTTVTELEHNYRILEKKWLDRITQYNEEIKQLLLGEESGKYWNQDTIDLYSKKKRDAIDRYKLIKSTYKLLATNWDLLKPTIPINDEEYSRRMNAKIPNGWTPASFWE
ncbi:MAG: hypothetical protein ACFBSE_02305 [Prochloraceae cyanobacterium]